MTLYQILPLLQGSLSGTLLVLVLWKNWKGTVNRLFAAFLLSMTLWGFLIFGMRFSSDLNVSLLWERAAIVFMASSSVTFYHFTVRYTNTEPSSRFIFLNYIYLFMVVALSPTSLIIDGMGTDRYGNNPIGGTLFFIWLGQIYLLVSVAVYQLAKTRKASGSYAERNRLLYFIIGTSAVLVGGIIDLLSIVGIPIFPTSIIANIVFAVLTSIAILKFQLFDIQFGTFRATPYIIIAILVGGISAGLYFAFDNLWVGERIPIWPQVLLTIAVALGIQPLWKQVQHFTNKLFYRGRYEHLESLRNLQEEAMSISDPDTINTYLPRLIRKAMQSSHLCLLLSEDAAADFKMESCVGADFEDTSLSLPASCPLTKWLSENDSVLRQEDMEVMPQMQGLTVREEATLEEMGGTLYVPLKSVERLVGLIIMGPKTNLQPYSWEDERLLLRIANQMALTIENVHLYQSSLHRENKLSALAKLNKTMSSTLDIQSMYDIFADELKKTVPVDWASIVLIEEEELRFFALSTSIKSAWGQPGTTIPIKGTSTEWVAMNKMSIVESNISEKSRFCTGDAHREDGIKSLAHMPLISKGEVIGSFNVGSTEPDAYSEKETGFLEQVSSQLTMALENARMYSREKGERARLEAMNKQRDELFGIISHELKTPLTAIKSSSELLSEELSKKRQPTLKRLIQNVTRSADRLEVMLNSFLDTAKAQSNSLEVNLRLLDIIPSVQSAVDLCYPPMEQKQQLLTTDIPKSLPPVMIDPDGFEQILTNLLGNANKFTPKGGKITIRIRDIRSNGSKIVIDVEDSGTGIPDEEQDLIFEPFYRGRFSMSGIRGMGVGLATVKQLVKLHSGTISLKSKDGEGSTFTVSLPLL